MKIFIDDQFIAIIQTTTKNPMMNNEAGEKQKVPKGRKMNSNYHC